MLMMNRPFASDVQFGDPDGDLPRRRARRRRCRHGRRGDPGGLRLRLRALLHGRVEPRPARHPAGAAPADAAVLRLGAARPARRSRASSSACCCWCCCAGCPAGSSRRRGRLRRARGADRTGTRPGSPTSRPVTARSRQRQTEHALQLADRRTRLADLDRRHAHLACRLEVDAEVVEEHALGRFDLEQLARPACRSRARACGCRPCSIRRRRRTWPSRRRPPDDPRPARRRAARRCSSGRPCGSRRR